MHKAFFGLLTAAAVAVLPQLLRAAEAQKPDPPGRPNPEAFFQKLDRNHDGVITFEEIPADAPEPLKAMLKRADSKGDGKVTLDGLREAMKDARPGGPREGRGPGGFRAPGGPGGYGPPGGPPGAGGGRSGFGFGFGFGRGGPGPRPEGESKREGPAGGPPDLETLFKRIDKDKDGKLSFEEFSEGMKEVHSSIVARFGGFRAPGGAGMGEGPRGRPGGGPMGWGGPHGPGGPMGPHGRPGPMGWQGPMGRGGMGWGGGPMGGGGGRGPQGPMGWHRPPGPMPGGPMNWWSYAARLPLPPFAPGQHFGAISKRLLEFGEGPRPDLQRLHRQLDEVQQRLKALETKLGAVEAEKAPTQRRKRDEEKPQPPKKD